MDVLAMQFIHASSSGSAAVVLCQQADESCLGFLPAFYCLQVTGPCSWWRPGMWA
jgi:hypothetical protein